MLDYLRTASTGWTAKILIGLLVLSFAVWGISGSLFYGNTTTVAEVGDTKVSTLDFRLAYENQLGALSQQFGRRLTRQQADGLGLRQNVVSQVVAGAVLDENARKMGLGIGETQLAEVIASDPAFRDLSGNFSRNALAVTLRQYGITEENYIASRKRVALRNQIQAGATDALDLPKAFNAAYTQYLNEKRSFDFVEIGPEIVETQPTPTDGDLSAYYEENKADYIAPEYRKLNVINLQAADLVKLDEVTDDELAAEYDNRKSQLRSPERRTVEQLVLSNPEEAATVSEKLKGGQSFEGVVEELGKKVSDLSLGEITATELPDGKIGSAAFAAELNKPTEIVEGIFGPVILRVTNIKQESTTPFDEIKEQLRYEIALRRSNDAVYELYDAVEEERGAGELIVPTAQKLQLASRVIDAVDSNGLDENGNQISGIPNIQQLAREAFDSQPGDDTRPLEIGNDGFIWFEVETIIPERQKPLDEVKTLVSEAWVANEINKQVKALADEIVERANAGEEFETVIAELVPTDSFGQAIKPTTTEMVNRQDQNPNINPRLLQAGFGLAKGDVAATASSDEKYAILRISNLELPADSKLEADAITNINVVASQDLLSQLVQDLQSRESISINQTAIDAAFNPYGGGGHRGM